MASPYYANRDSLIDGGGLAARGLQTEQIYIAFAVREFVFLYSRRSHGAGIDTLRRWLYTRLRTNMQLIAYFAPGSHGGLLSHIPQVILCPQLLYTSHAPDWNLHEYIELFNLSLAVRNRMNFVVV